MVSIVSTVIISLSILIFGLFLVIFVNFEGIIERLGRRMAVDVYLIQGIGPSRIDEISKKLSGLPDVTEIEFISAETAYNQFKQMLGPQADLLDELGENPLPASFRLTVRKESRNPDSLSRIAQNIEIIDGVDEVRYGAKWVDRFQTVITSLKAAGSVIGAILLLASVLIISNTIRLTVYSRSDEIEIMRLVGATETMIRAPFFLEGLFQGFIAGCLAVGLLWVFFKILLSKINLPLIFIGPSQLIFLPAWAMTILIAGGTLLGIIGSIVALARFMKR